MKNGAKTVIKKEKREIKEKSETRKRMDELRKAMQDMGVRHATVENVTRYLLDVAVQKYSAIDKDDNTNEPVFDDVTFLKDLATGIRGYDVKINIKEIITPELDW